MPAPPSAERPAVFGDGQSSGETSSPKPNGNEMASATSKARLTPTQRLLQPAATGSNRQKKIISRKVIKVIKDNSEILQFFLEAANCPRRLE